MTVWTDRFTGSFVDATPTSYASYSLSANLTLVWPLEQTTSTNICASTVDLNASGSGLIVTLPNATLVSTGRAVLFNNVGAITLTIKDSGGATVLSMPAASSYYLYLVDNSTAAGTWRSIAFNGGTPAASTYAGPGLTVVGSQLGTAHPVTSYAANYAVLSTDRASLLNWTGGGGTFTLPTAASVGNNWFVALRNSGSGALTVARSSSDTFNGASATSFTLNIGDSAFFASAGGTVWYTIGFGQSLSVSTTYLAKDVSASGTITLSTTEAAYTIINFFGALTSNTTVVFPAAIGEWTLRNSTSGAYTLSVKLNGSASSTGVTQGYQAIYYGDGTDMYNAVTAVPAAPAGFAAGTAANPSMYLSTTPGTGLYFPSSSTMAFAAGGSQVFLMASTGLYVNGVQLTDSSNNIATARLGNWQAQIAAGALLF